MSDDVLHKLEEALAQANTATAADVSNDYVTAIKYYLLASDILDQLIQSIPDDKKQLLLDRTKSYKARAEELQLSSPNQQIERIGSKRIVSMSIDMPKIEEIPEPPVLSHRRPFWLLKLLKKTIQTGGYLTKKVYVPKTIWYQDGGRIHGMGIKLITLETIVEYMDKLHDLPGPVTPETVNIFQQTLDEFLKQLVLLQTSLSRQFSFILEPDIIGVPLKSPTKRGISKFTNIAVGLGRMVKNQALTAVEKVGGVTPSSHIDTPRYLELACLLCDKVQILDIWLSKDDQNSATNYTLVSEKDQLIRLCLVNNPPIVQQLHKISKFLLTVVCELMIRDLRELLTRHITRTSKALGNINWN